MFITIVVIYFILASMGKDNILSVNNTSIEELVEQAKNQDKDYPTNMGQKWTDEEENTLLQELDNFDILTKIFVFG